MLDLATDNVLTRREHIKKNIDEIKEKKQKILDVLKNVSKGEETDKELMGKLVNAFDTLDQQEQAYLSVLIDIANIHENATEDVAKDFTLAVEGIRAGQTDAGPDQEQTDALKDLETLSKELAEVQAQAVAASLLNEQLLNQFSQQKQKHHSLNEFRSRSSTEQKQRQKSTLADVEAARIRVTGERQDNDRKQKQLERLRKEAVKRGILLGAEEEKKKKELIASVEQSNERIPAVEKREGEKEGEEKEAETAQEKTDEERRREIRAKIKEEKERRDQVAAQIRERLTAMDVRKQRMDAIGQMLSQMHSSLERSVDGEEVAPNTNTSTDEAETDAELLERTFQSAQQKLKNLTAWREKLEKIHASGAGLAGQNLSLPETALLEEGLAEQRAEDQENRAEESGDARQNPLVTSSQSTVAPDEDLLNEVSVHVRDSFEELMASRRRSKGGRWTGLGASTTGTISLDSSAFQNHKSNDETGRLEAILNRHTIMLQRIDDKLGSRTSAPYPCGSPDPHPTDSPVELLRSLLLSSSPVALSSFSELCSRLAQGESVPDLDLHLTAFVKSASYQNSETTTTMDESSTLCESHVEPSEDLTTVKHIAIVAPNRQITSTDEAAPQKRDSYDDEKRKEHLMEAVRREFSKQSAETIEKAWREEEHPVIEETLREVIARVSPILNATREQELDEETLTRIRDQTVQCTSEACPTIPQHLLETQLGSVVLHCLGTSLGVSLGSTVDRVLDDLAEVLYNELSFFHLLDSLNTIPDNMFA